jgi:hypothetical protein
VGVPQGGATDYVLAKISPNDFDVAWVAGAAGGSADGAFRNVIIFKPLYDGETLLANQFDYTPPPGLKRIRVHVQGAGGGGGGTPASVAAAASGGSGGGYGSCVVEAENLQSIEQVTVGIGGNGGKSYENYHGVQGTSSSFGVHVTASGGSGANNGTGSTSINTLDGGTAWFGLHPVESSMFVANGGAGWPNVSAVSGGAGGYSFLGGLSGPHSYFNSSRPALGYGSGGGGGRNNSINAVPVDGAKGADGVVIIEEFF